MADLLKKEHYDLMAAFEREHSGRMGKEDKSLWPRGIIYQDGAVNELFLAFRRGHAYAMAVARASAPTPPAAQPVDPNVIYGDGFHDGYLKGRQEGYDAAQDEQSSAPTPPAATAAPSDDCDDVDAILRIVGLDPERCRTEGGMLNVGRVRTLWEDVASPAAQASGQAARSEP